jgi:hypothetical protein
MNKQIETLIKSYGRDTIVKRAQSIINEAKSHEVYEDELPEEEDDQILLAEELVEVANDAFNEGNRSEAVTSIKFAAEILIDNSENKEPEEEQTKLGRKDDELYEAEYKEALTEPTELPIPPEIQEEIPELPLDLTELSDKEVMRFHGAFNALSARANWLYAQQEAGESAAKKIVDHMYDLWVVTANKVDPTSKKPKTKDVLRAEAIQEVDSLGIWVDRQQTHATKAKKLSRLRDIYDNNCDRLSRHWTMITEERRT